MTKELSQLALTSMCEKCMSRLKPMLCTVKTNVLEDKTVYKEYFCTRCLSKLNYMEVANKVKFCANCGQRIDW